MVGTFITFHSNLQIITPFGATVIYHFISNHSIITVIIAVIILQQ